MLPSGWLQVRSYRSGRRSMEDEETCFWWGMGVRYAELRRSEGSVDAVPEVWPCGCRRWLPPTQQERNRSVLTKISARSLSHHRCRLPLAAAEPC